MSQGFHCGALLGKPAVAHVRVHPAGTSPAARSAIDSTVDSIPAVAARFPDRIYVHRLAEAGHWVHVDALDRLVELCASQMPTPAP